MNEQFYVSLWIEEFQAGKTIFNEDYIRRNLEMKYSELCDKRAVSLIKKMLDRYKTGHEWVLNTYYFIKDHPNSGSDSGISRLNFFLNGAGPGTAHPNDVNRYIDFVLHESRNKFPQKEIEEVVKNQEDFNWLKDGFNWIIETKKYFMRS